MSVILKTGAAITVASSGTAVQLPTIDRVVAVYFSGPAANAGIMYIGGSTVSVSIGTPVVKSTVVSIHAPDGQFIDIANIWADAGTSGDKLVYSYLQKTN